jgi:hypothetical protein
VKGTKQKVRRRHEVVCIQREASWLGWRWTKLLQEAGQGRACVGSAHSPDCTSPLPLLGAPSAPFNVSIAKIALVQESRIKSSGHGHDVQFLNRKASHPLRHCLSPLALFIRCQCCQCCQVGSIKNKQRDVLALPARSGLGAEFLTATRSRIPATRLFAVARRKRRLWTLRRVLWHHIAYAQLALEAVAVAETGGWAWAWGCGAVREI